MAILLHSCSAMFTLTNSTIFVKKELGIKYYGRYVDDFIIVHPNKDYLRQIIPVIKDYLQTELMLTLHPKKIYLQHFSKGVQFLGAIIKPYRNYVSSRTKSNFYIAVKNWNTILQNEETMSEIQKQDFLSTINSYLGIMNHYKTNNLKNKIMFESMDKKIWNYFAPVF